MRIARLVASAMVAVVYLCLVYLVVVGSVHLSCNPIAAFFIRVCGFSLMTWEGYGLMRTAEEFNT